MGGGGGGGGGGGDGGKGGRGGEGGGEGLTFHCRPSGHSHLAVLWQAVPPSGMKFARVRHFAMNDFRRWRKQASVGSAQQSESKQSRPWPEHGGGGGGLGGEGGGGGERLGGGGGGDGGVEGDGGGGGGESHSCGQIQRALLTHGVSSGRHIVMPWLIAWRKQPSLGSAQQYAGVDSALHGWKRGAHAPGREGGDEGGPGGMHAGQAPQLGASSHVQALHQSRQLCSSASARASSASARAGVVARARTRGTARRVNCIVVELKTMRDAKLERRAVGGRQTRAPKVAVCSRAPPGERSKKKKLP